jgi:hypothetical protein
MLTTQNIVITVVLLLVFPVFFFMPFYVVKLMADEAKRDPKELPDVKRRLWIRAILMSIVTVAVPIGAGDFKAILGTFVFPLPMAAYCWGKLIMLQKIETKAKTTPKA